jgi:hypothetical protein
MRTLSSAIERLIGQGQILLQHGGMFHARKGDLYASYPR